jgi:hypothetical protein
VNDATVADDLAVVVDLIDFLPAQRRLHGYRVRVALRQSRA